MNLSDMYSFTASMLNRNDDKMENITAHRRWVLHDSFLEFSRSISLDVRAELPVVADLVKHSTAMTTLRMY